MKARLFFLGAVPLAIRRRKGSSALLAAVMLIVGGVCVVLGGLRVRQKAALTQMVAESQIQCVATSANGRADQIAVLSPYLDMVIGKRHSRGCYLDEYVKDVKCMATCSLEAPRRSELRYLYTVDSDPLLRPGGGGTVTFSPGWGPEVFSGTEKVCVVDEALADQIELRNGVEVLRVVGDGVDTELPVVGRVKGLGSRVVYCPFYAQMEPGMSYAHPMDSLSFLIRDNTRLEEAKEQLFSYFIHPSLSQPEQWDTAGLLVQDETYLASLAELRGNLALLGLLLPVLLIMAALLTFLAGYLTNRRRLREFAVLRCMGQKKRGIFLQVLLEQGGLVLLGCIAGLIVGSIAVGLSAAGAICALGSALAGLAGCAGSAAWICRASPIELMRAEE